MIPALFGGQILDCRHENDRFCLGATSTGLY